MNATLVAHGRLTEWAIACLEAVGVPPVDARIVAESLVQTSLWGVDSHGILRLTHYLRRMSIGSVVASAAPVARRTGPVTAQIDGMDGLGILHAMRAMELAMDMALASGVGVVGVSDSSHCGAMGLYTRTAARRNLIGIAFTHSSSVVAPHGGKEKFFGTNPLSIAFPRSRGEPTTDPHQAEALIPLGGGTYGYKGYGLAFMIDLLCGALNGMSYGPHITKMYEELDRPRKIGHLLIALDPKRFAGAATLEATAERMIAELRTKGDILYPGEPEVLEEAKRRGEGIPIEPAALADMNAWSERLHIQPLTHVAAA